MAALVDSCTLLHSFVRPSSSSQSMHTTTQRNGDSRPIVSPSHRHNQTIVPGTSSADSLPLPLPPPPRQLVSAIASFFSSPQNHNFPSIHFPHPHPHHMLTIRRSNKLRKHHSPHISPTPPVLAPLSFIQDSNIDLDFEYISHHVLPFSPQQSQLSLTRPQDVPSPELCQQTRPRKLTKRPKTPAATLHQQVPSSSSAAAAAAAITGNPAAPLSSSVSNPHRARSDVGHGLRYSVSIKRANIIRRLSMRTPKPSFDSQATTSGLSSSTTTGGPSTPTSTSSSMGILSKWRGAISELTHDSINVDPPVSLPLVRISSPFSIYSPSNPDGEAKTPQNVSMTDIPACTPTVYDTTTSNHIPVHSTFPRHRPKFTLEEGNESEAELSTNPPSPKFRIATFNSECHSAPPSRVHSAYNNPQYLSPAPRSRLEHNSIKPPRRRWTFAMAMTDEDITDEVLVEELDRMRLRKEWSGSIDDMDEVWDPDYVLFGTSGTTQEPESITELTREEEPHHHRQLLLGHSSSSSSSGYHHHHHHNLQRHSQHSSTYTTSSSISSNPRRHNSVPLPDSGSAGSTQQWQTARRVLLTCRELVRTERHYLASLQTLLNSETEGTPPPLMLRYAEELVRVNQSYLIQMEGNPSSWGVAAAFLAVEEEIESAFVGWCGVVGMWFDDNTSTYENKQEEEDQEELTAISRIRKISATTWRRSFTSITELSASVTPGGSKKREKGTAPPPSFSLYGNVRQRRSSTNGTSKAKKPPTIRDLAILPTQRIMRYVLLYRDLLEHTSATSPSRGLIKRAADSALRIAQKCDRAQTNSAFIVHNDTNNQDDTPYTNTLC